MNLFAIPPHVPFLDAIAAEWLETAGHDAQRVARGLILLPTRRAARALAEAFLRATHGRPLLLPRITALGALDEAPLALSGALTLPPPVEPAERLAVLARLILALDGKFGAPRSADRAWMLAAELASLMDEAEREGVDLAAKLPDAANAEYAAHWQRTLEFLDIVTEAWPAWLAERELMNPAARQVALLEAQARAWEQAPPDAPVWIAGSTGGVPALAELLRVVARLPAGRVILPGLDFSLPEEIVLDPSHPQAGVRRLLARLGARLGDVRRWPDFSTAVPETRAASLWRALLPAGSLAAWREPANIGIAGLERLAPADQQEEAAAIALVLREALQIPGRRAALVTPDRDLAGRVAAELLRWGVVADDSAGEPLAETPPAVFLRLLATAVVERLAPVPLLALLKHPFAAAGLAPPAARAAARELEVRCLRGPRPNPGITGLRRALDRAGVQGAGPARDLLARLEACLEPLWRVAASVKALPAEMFAALIGAAEALAGTDTEPGPARLWAREEGEALANLLAEVQAALPVLPDQPPSCLPGLLDAVLEGAVVRSRRALRGRADGSAEHPRLFIWGLLEARLQAVDLMVLGGLAEGVWPPDTDPGPWMSRPMRDRVGLPSPEEHIGQAAHDFVMAACAAPRVVRSCPRRRDGAPAVPARWLTRLDAMLAGAGCVLPTHPATRWARLLDQPRGRAAPAPPPRPCPPLALRPRRMRVTEIETWLTDPYAIHARHILRLEPIDPLEQPTDAADYGSLVHAALHRFLQETNGRWPADAEERLCAVMDRALREAGLRPALEAWWAPRLARIARWVAATEAERRAVAPPALLRSEVSGEWVLDCPGGFQLRGRADRIERRADGTLSILDYKTGYVPSQKQVERGLAPQLLLEAAMAAAGAFGPELAGKATELAYWHLTGGFEPGKACPLFKKDAFGIAEAVQAARRGLRDLVQKFDDPACPYLAQPHAALAVRASQYAQLARIGERAAAEQD